MRNKEKFYSTAAVLFFLISISSVVSAAPFAYITNYEDNTISVIDIATNNVTATVDVGINPWGVAVNPAGTKVYVTNIGSNNISVIDTSNNTVIDTVPVGIWSLRSCSQSG